MDSLSMYSPAKASSSSSNSSNSTSEMSVEEKFRIVRSVGEECIQEELMKLLAHKPEPVCYDGFEPSGRMHIAQFAQLNNKMGGDLKKIQTVGRYMIVIWKAVGLDPKEDKVEFLCSSEEINSRVHEYWPLVMDIARRNKLPRIMRCVQIMGRSEQEELTDAQILYPCMQCADISFLKRKVNIVAREYCEDIKGKNKPIILAHHMLPGLQQGQEKMSKSDPSSSIFMEDEDAEVNLKIKKAYCPPSVVEGNPCLEYIKYIIFPWTFNTYEELVAEYESGLLHPADLKPALSNALNKILQGYKVTR
ncbi:Tyrosine--tRNA ligase [Bertholletia excelsa]